MPKDTKTLGNNKARACESLGFAHKKRLCQRFDTTSFSIKNYVEYLVLGLLFFPPYMTELIVDVTEFRIFLHIFETFHLVSIVG